MTAPANAANQVYTVNNSAETINWSAFTVTPADCLGYTYESVITPTPDPVGAIAVDIASRTITVHSTDLKAGWSTDLTTTPMSYQVSVNVLAADGTTKYTALGEQWTSQIQIIDPCATAVIDLSAVVPSTTQ